MAEEALREIRDSFQQLAFATYVQMVNDPEPFNGLPSECIDTWINKSRKICNLGIPDETAARLLVLNLKGDARKFVEGQPDVVVNDLTHLQNALINQYHGVMHVNSAKAQLRSEKWRVDDTPSKMFNRLQPLIMKIHAGTTPARETISLNQHYGTNSQHKLLF